MLRRMLWSALVLLVGVTAAPAADKDVKPAIEFRMKSVQDLSENVGYFAKLVDKPEAGDQITSLIKLFVDNPKGFEGVSLKKPIGGYIGISEDVASSPVVLMIPVADDESFVNLLSGKAGLDPKKGDDGVYSLDVPNVPFKVYFRFANGYAYATVRSEKSISKANLIKPDDFFAEKLTPVFGLKVNFEMIPEDMRKAAYGQLELKLQEMAKNAQGNELQKLIHDYLVDVAAESSKVLFTDAKDLSLIIDVKPKTDDLDLKLVLTPKTGSTLAKNFDLWKDRPSKAAGLGATKNPIYGMGWNFSLPKGATEKLGKLADALLEKGLDDAAGEERDIKKQVFGSIIPTVKSGKFELGMSLIESDKKPMVIGAMVTKEGMLVDKALKAIARFIPASEGSIDLDKSSEKGFNLHEITLEDSEFTKVVSKQATLAISDDLIGFVTATGSKGLKLLTDASTEPVPMMSNEISWARVMKYTPDTAKFVDAATKQVFGKTPVAGNDTMRTTISGGKQLTIDMTVKGKAVAFLAAIDKLKKE